MFTAEKSFVFPGSLDSLTFAGSRDKNSNDPSRHRYAAHPITSKSRLPANAATAALRVRRSQNSASPTPIPSCGFSASPIASKLQAFQSRRPSNSSTHASPASAVNSNPGLANVSAATMGRHTSPTTSINAAGPAPIRIRQTISAQAIPNSAPERPSNSIAAAGHPTRANGNANTSELGGYTGASAQTGSFASPRAAASRVNAAAS